MISRPTDPTTLPSAVISYFVFRRAGIKPRSAALMAVDCHAFKTSKWFRPWNEKPFRRLPKHYRAMLAFYGPTP